VTNTTSWALPALCLALLAACADGLEPVPFQGVSGSVAFSGALPDSTEWVRVGAYRDLPETDLDLLGFAGISEPLALARDSAGYVVGLESGVFEWIPVVWKQEGVALPNGLRVLGWYTDGGGAIDPAELVLVTADEENGGINLIADFENALTIEEALEILR
jgi:hypothetical protein